MRENYNESKQLSNIQSYQNDLVVKNFKNKELIQSSENSSINTLATNSSQHLSTSKKENLNISTETSSLTNSHSTLNPGENGKTPSFVSNHSSKMTEITENECSSITQKAFVNNSVGSSENSLNSTTPTNKRSLNSVASDNNKPANTNNSNTMFELNDKHPSITLSCHSSETSSVNDSRSSIPKNSKKDQKNNEKNDKADENENNESTGNKKFGFKHLRKTISKTFSKASFRTFSISHKKTANGTVTGASMEPAQDLGFTSKDEEEEFNNFVNTLNMKKNKQRPSLNGLFLNPELSSSHNNNENSLTGTIKEEPSLPSSQTFKLKNSDNKLHKSSEKMKDAPIEMNEMKNIQGNSRKQAPVIIDRKGRRK